MLRFLTAIILTAHVCALSQPSWAEGEKGEVMQLSLEEAWQLALKNSSGIKSARQETYMAEARLKQANSLFMPKLTFTGSFARSDDQVAVFGSKLRQERFSQSDFDLARLNNPDSVNNFETKIAMSVPLFTSGMNLNSHRAAKNGLKAGRLGVKFGESNLKMNIAKVYYGVLSAQEVLSHLNEGIDHLEKLEQSYKLISAPNSATTTCYLLSQATRLAVEQKREETKTAIGGMTDLLKSMLELPQDVGIALTDKFEDAYDIEDTKTGEGTTTRADIQSLSYRLEALRYEKKSAYSMLGPRLDFFTWYAYNTPDFKDGGDAYMFGLALTFDIFDYSKYGRLGEIRAAESALRLAYAENLKNNRTAAKTARDRHTGKRASLELAKSSFQKADEALRFARQRYREGTLPLKDLSSAIAGWVEAKVNVSNSKYELAASHIDYKFERGDI